MTDYWKPYTIFIPRKRHVQSKAETYSIEGFNCVIRHFLARFHRKTLCYSKSVLMMRYSLLLLVNHRNNQQNIKSILC